ncbi:GntR family transcriptional regulator [Nocardioides sp. GXZ039]|uniref:GntR family transcriptional regulator n=1 Tax=Nocardioides sp. GXZ039 TaxID=3136018 RepID=UPI0030F48400
MGSTEPTQAQSKAQIAYAWIHEQIATRRFGPGHRLVLQQLADELGVSVAPVREAIRRLEAEGQVTFSRNVGATVAIPDEHAYRDLMESLAVFEGAATALAAAHLRPADLARGRAINDRMRAMLDSIDSFDPPEFTRLNQDFHSVLFAPCPNDYLRRVVDECWTSLDRMRETTFTFIPGRATQSVREHDQILELLEKGAEVDEVERAVRAHRLATLTSYLDR